MLRFIFELFYVVFDFIVNFVLNLWFQRKGKEQRGKLPPITNPILLDSALTLAAKIRNERLSSVEVVQAYIDRINAVNKFINAIVDQRFEEALKDAARADGLVARYRDNQQELERTHPLLGVPFTTKNYIKVKGLINDTGSVTRKNLRADCDAEVISRLVEAGAIPLAITNVPEMCMSIECMSVLHGRTNNPYDLNRTPGGSSGGEGALISSCGSVFGIGTDIGGSIRVPSIFCGVFGHKPSAGIVSVKGLDPPFHPEAEKINCVGPICRYASDVSTIYKIIAGPSVSKLQLDKPVNLSKIQIHYMDDEGAVYLSRVSDDLRYAVRRCVAHFVDTHGCSIVSETRLGDLRDASSLWTSYFIGTGATPWREVFKIPPKAINPKRELTLWLAGLSQHTIFSIVLSWLDKRARKKRHRATQENNFKRLKALKQLVDEILGDDGILIFPAALSVAPYHYTTLLAPSAHFGMTTGFNAIGVPVTACPVGLNKQGLPLSVQVVAAHKNDRLCLAVARELEKAFGGWKSPSGVNCLKTETNGN